ncbi:MAG: HAD-IA family hydrolase [Dissulfurispiraceae bacterium]|jgi:phosphoglycolate phosphatase|nr:HAD-IA family hydrolase [Dissulfurispiraceae bacterium]
MPLKLLIFDLDGTLVDSSIDLCNSINHAIKPYGVEPLTVQKTISLIGEGVTRLMEKAAVKYSIPASELGAILARFLAYYDSHLLDNTLLYPGVKETIESLGSIKKVVVTNKRTEQSVKILKGLGILNHFSLVLGSDSLTEKKPSPMPLMHAMKEFGAARHEAVMIGDSTYDIDAGRAAGIKTVALTWGYRPADLLKDADFLISSIAELPYVLVKIED